MHASAAPEAPPLHLTCPPKDEQVQGTGSQGEWQCAEINNIGHTQNALEGWVRGMEACKSEQEGQRREKEEELYADLEGLKAQLDDFERRNAALHGETLLPAACLPASVVVDLPGGHAASVSKASVFCLTLKNRNTSHCRRPDCLDRLRPASSLRVRMATLS